MIGGAGWVREWEGDLATTEPLHLLNETSVTSFNRVELVHIHTIPKRII